MSLHSALRFLWTYLRPLSGFLLLLVTLLTGATVLRLLLPQLLRSLVDRTMEGAPLPELVLPAGLFLAAALLIPNLRFAPERPQESPAD